MNWMMNAKLLKTWKWGKAQRVARLAHANATVHFLLTYRQAMQMTFKNQPVAYLSHMYT